MDDRHYLSLDTEDTAHEVYSVGSDSEHSASPAVDESSAVRPVTEGIVIKPRKRVILLPSLASSKSALDIEPEPPALGLLNPESENFQRTITVVPVAADPALPAGDRSVAQGAQAAAESGADSLSHTLSDALNDTSEESLFWHYLRQGNTLFQAGKTDEAIAAYHQALQFNSESVEVYQHLAQSLSQQGNLAEAASYYRKAIELTAEEEVEQPSVDPEASSDDQEALPWYEEAAFYLQQGKAHYQRRNWDAAISACEQAVQLLGSKSAEAFHILGQALQEQGRFEEAKQSYQQALNLQPQEADFYAYMASVHAEQDQLQDAIRYYQQALKLNPNFAAAYWEIGELWRKLGDRNRASEAWYHALQLEPSWANAKEHWRLGTALTEQGKLKQAVRSYEQAIRLDPNFAEAYHNLGVVLGKLDKWQEALKYHRQAATLKPTSALFWAGQGRTLIALESWEEAIACYQKVTKLNLNGGQGYAVFQHAQAQIEQCQKALVAQSYAVMAERLAQQQQWQEAVSCYRQAIQRYPNPHHYASLGQALAALEQWEEAIEAYQQAIELAPERTEYKLAFGDVLIQREQLQKQLRLQTALHAEFKKSPESSELFKESENMEAADSNLFTLL